MARPGIAVGDGRTTDRGLRYAKSGLLLAAALWSLAGVFIKFLPLDPLTIVFYRSLFASLFFACLSTTRVSLPPGALLVAAASYTAAITSFVSANKLTTAANAIVLQYTAPTFVFIIVYFLFREVIAAAGWMALLLGMVGIGVIFWGSVGQPDAPGVIVALLSGVLFAVYMVSLRYLSHVHAATLTFINNASCCLMLLPFVWSELAIASDQALILAVMGVVQLGVPYWLFSKAIVSVPVQEASLIVLIEPVLNPIWVAFAVGEMPSAATLTGGALIISGLGVRYLWAARP